MNKYLVKIAASLDPYYDPNYFSGVDRGKARFEGIKEGLKHGLIGAGVGALAAGIGKPSMAKAIAGASVGAGLMGWAGYSSGQHRNLGRQQDKIYTDRENSNLTKKAFQFKEHSKDIRDTGIIAGLGGVGSMVSNRLLGHKEAFNPKAFAVGAGVGLVADYAGLKINKALNGPSTKETNVPI